MLKLLLTGESGKDFSVQDVRDLQKRLRAIEPKLRTEFMREVKAIGKEPQKAIRQAIPTSPPLSGLDPSGRGRNAKIQWGKVTKGPQAGGAKSTTIRFRTQSGGKSLNTTLLGIRVNSAASSIADMAGRSGRSVGAGYRGSGRTKPTVRTYKDGSQSVVFTKPATRKAGEAFIRNLNSRLGNNPSRMVYKAVEKNLPKISKDVQFVVNKWAIQYSKGF
jgi:hypothetical protein